MRLGSLRGPLVLTFFFAGCGGFGGSGAAVAPSTAPAGITRPPATAPVTTRTPAPRIGTPGFKAAARMARPRGQHTATLMNDGRVLVVGGVDATAQGPSFVVESEVYDPLADAFTKTTVLGGDPGGHMTAVANVTAALPPVALSSQTFPVTRMLHAAVLLADGRVLVAGGYGVESLDAQGMAIQGDLASAHVFDPRTNTFRAVGSLKVARRNARGVLLPSGQVLIVGGARSAELFDPVTETFTRAADVTSPAEGLLATFAGGRALVVGAAGSEELDASAGTFGGASKPAFARVDATLDAIGPDGALLAGGGRSAGGVVELERYSRGAWTTVGKLSSPRSRHASAPVVSGVLLAGGVAVSASGNQTTLATADFVDAATNAVQSFAMAHERNGCAVTALATGELLVTGGFEKGTTDPAGYDGTSVAEAERFVAPGTTMPSLPPVGVTPPVQTPPTRTPPVQTPPTQTPPVQTPPVQTPPTQTPPTPPTPSLSFATDLQPVLAAKCTVCHPGAGQPSLRTYSDTMKFVVAGSPSTSQLVRKTQAGGSMSVHLTTGEAATIRQWIDQGAKP